MNNPNANYAMFEKDRESKRQSQTLGLQDAQPQSQIAKSTMPRIEICTRISKPQTERNTMNTDTTKAALQPGWKYGDLNEDQILELRYSRALAYKAGHYKMQPPPVCTTLWDDEAWQNWVKFDREILTGFLPYTNQTAED